MALKIYSSSSVELLADKVAKNIHKDQGVFVPEFVITTGVGVNNWLKVKLAKSNEIAANLVFKKQHEIFIKQMILDQHMFLMLGMLQIKILITAKAQLD